MIQLLLLSAVTLSISLLSYELSYKDIFSPSFLFSISYTVSIICCALNAERWGVELNIKTIAAIMLALCAFSLGELTARGIYKNRTRLSEADHRLVVSSIPVAIIIIIIIFDIIITYLLYQDILKIANLNYQEWGNLTYNFKTNQGDGEAALSPIVNYGTKLSKAFAYCTLYVVINSIINNNTKSIKTIILYILYAIPVLFIVVQSLMKGVRIQIIALVFSAIFLYYVCMQQKKGWGISIRLSNIIKIIIVTITVSFLFYQSKELVGRQQSDMSGLAYVTTYLGGPIELLNLYMINGVSGSKGLVIETMGGLVSSLQKIGLFPGITVNAVREYRNSATGIPIGNVYGAIRDYYHDFGFFGIFIFCMLISMIIYLMYQYIKYGKNKNSCIELTIVYSSFVYAIFFLTFSDFLTAKLSLGSLIEISFIIIITKILLHFSGKRNYSIKRY